MGFAQRCGRPGLDACWDYQQLHDGDDAGSDAVESGQGICGLVGFSCLYGTADGVCFERLSKRCLLFVYIMGAVCLGIRPIQPLR
jgi:hypothetical protein